MGPRAARLAGRGPGGGVRRLSEVARDFAALKEERSHSRVVVPGAAQVETNAAFIGSLLEGTEIEQAELAGLSLEVAASAVNSIASVDGGIAPEELFAVVGSLWIDGLILGLRYGHELYGSDNWTPDSEATEAPLPTTEPDRIREAANDDPRSERDR